MDDRCPGEIPAPFRLRRIMNNAIIIILRGLFTLTSRGPNQTPQRPRQHRHRNWNWNRNLRRRRHTKNGSISGLPALAFTSAYSRFIYVCAIYLYAVLMGSKGILCLFESLSV